MPTKKEPGDDRYKSVKLTREAYEELQALQQDLVRKGLDSIPRDVLPADCSTITLSVACQIAARTMKAMRKVK